MADWLPLLVRLSGSGTPAVLVTVVDTRGSVPREAGTKMVVADEATFGTIGGGRLEYEALQLARAMLAGSAAMPQLRRFGLGPSLGQCCGGSARVLLEPVWQEEPWLSALQALVERREPAALVTAIGDRGAEKIVVSAGGVSGVLSDPRRHGEAVAAARALLSDGGAGTRLQEADGGAVLLFEGVRPETFQIVLLGAGHVGKALARVLGELPCRVTWVDERAEQFPHEVPANVTVECTDMPQYAIERAPPGAAFLVMTHSHALDLALCERILRRGDFAYCGLIGSTTKRAKFVKRLQARGLPGALIGRMVCPIGIPELTGKHPGEIAVAVAAQLLLVRAAGTRPHPARPAKATPEPDMQSPPARQDRGDPLGNRSS
jgi:xanthine dehydrogenase accessory factor